jgi:hypothetical protein
MRRTMAVAAAVLATSAAGIAGLRLLRPGLPAPSTLAALMPQGALIEIESKDFSSLVRQWNASNEKQLWVGSDNYEVFSRSRLYQRLDQSRGEFATAAGFPPDMSFLNAVAGSGTALGIYDIGKLEFLYITRMPATKAAETKLWQTRGHYETRDVNGRTFYVKTDLATQRTVAFAVTPDYLFLATREDLLASALKLLASNRDGETAALSGESWWSAAVNGAGEAEDDQSGQGLAPDVRMVLNLQALVRSPYFRSYWIQNNVSDLRPYIAARCDAYFSADGVREERVLVRSDGASVADAGSSAAAAGAGLADLAAKVPQNAGFYRGWASPSIDSTLDSLGEILAPQPGRPNSTNRAPEVNLDVEGGSADDLESRIDRAPPPSTAGVLDSAKLRALLQDRPLRALLEFALPRDSSGAVLADHAAAVLIEGATDWDGTAVRASVQSSIQGLWTTSRLGAEWEKESAGHATYYRLNGLMPLAVATDGELLALSTDPDLLVQILDSQGVQRPDLASFRSPLSYLAGLRLDLERDPYERTVAMIDYAGPAGGRFDTNSPRFFSGNLESLLKVAARVSSATVVTRDSGKVVQQTVVYRIGANRSASQR